MLSVSTINTNAVDGRLSIDATFVFFIKTLGSLSPPFWAYMLPVGATVTGETDCNTLYDLQKYDGPTAKSNLRQQ